ncbi:MAG: hypothetical protein GX937_12770 [Lentisphaerae bacterium]|jgi:hypothetical protein|nr:hypothetical protein [Lentisphaerota bacterium]
MEDVILLPRLMNLITTVGPAIKDSRVRARLESLVLGTLCGKNPKTITSILAFDAECGNRDNSLDDWSAFYRFFSQSSWELEEFFSIIFSCAMSFCKEGESIKVLIDDTLVRKTGKKIPGAAYARDPLSPPFHTNLVWGQRMVCISLLVRASPTVPYRSIPICFLLKPPVRLPKNATDEQRQEFKELKKKSNMSIAGRQMLDWVRKRLDAMPGGSTRRLIVAADGSFANRTFLEKPPHHTIIIARCRDDLNLRKPIAPDKKVGKRKYGDKVPTPKQINQDATIPEKELTTGVKHQRATVRYKTVDEVRWPTVLKNQPCCILTVKGQYFHKGGKRQQTKPAYLIVTGDYDIKDIEEILEVYLLRWEIEVGFRDQKNGLGIGKAQVWNENSVMKVPGFMSACYSMLMMASMRAFGDERGEQFAHLPRWRSKTPNRPSLRDLIELLRREVKSTIHKAA